MKHLFILMMIGFSSGIAQGQQDFLEGAWNMQNGAKQEVIIFQNGYFTSTTYQKDKFINSWGGPFKIKDNTIHIRVEFNAADNQETGSEISLTFGVANKLTLSQPGREPQVYTRIDHSTAPLAGVWKITARKQNGELVHIRQTGTRKTLKILTSTRFQWFAINPATKQFSGTGGGTYTFKNGKYIEHILFFSRDNSRAGAQLSFDGKLIDGKWHHSGLSSKGDPIYEVWEKKGI